MYGEEKRDVRWSQTLLKKEQILLSFNKVKSSTLIIAPIQRLRDSAYTTPHWRCYSAYTTSYRHCVGPMIMAEALHVLCTGAPRP